MVNRPNPPFRFEAHFAAGRPEEGERYPVFFRLGVNTESYADRVHEFFVLELPFCSVIAGKTLESYVVKGPWFLRFWWRHRCWTRLFGRRKELRCA